MEAHNTILVSIDFTDTSSNALAVALMLSRQEQTRIHLVYVRQSGSSESVQPGERVADLSDGQLIQEGASRIQKLAVQTAQENQVHCSGSCRVGNSPDEVAAAARALHAGLIVMGTHTGAGIRAFRTNNEAYQVITMVTCPVLTVPDNRQWTSFGNILFPVRPVSGALDKYEFARKISQQNKADVTILALSAPDDIISREQVQDELLALQTKLAKDGIRHQTVVCLTDSMAETVLNKARELQSDLLIITARLDTTADNFFIGPFTQQILHNAQVPVLAIRPESGVDPNAS